MTFEEFLSHLHPESFWDTDTATLDPQKHARFIIRRVMERGTREEVALVNSFYTRSDITDALVSARSLDPKTLSFFSAVLDIPKEQFRAARSRASTPWGPAC